MPRKNTGPKLFWNDSRERYYIRWYQAGRKFQKSTQHADLVKAQRVYAAFLENWLRIGNSTDPSELQITDALTYYYREHGSQCVDAQRIDCSIKALSGYWSGRLVSEINQASCRDYLRFRQADRPQGIKPATVRKDLGTLVAALNFCVLDGKLSHAPKVVLPEKSPPKSRWLTISEAASLLRAARKGGRNTRSYLPIFILIALYTGARSGAILSLTWDRVDLDAGRIDFQVKGERRTKKRKPQVPIPRQLLTFLRYAHRRRPHKYRAEDSGGWVINDDGKPIKRIIRSVKAAAIRAGLNDVSPHTLRHTCGTWMAQQGTSLWDIAGWLGQDIETTERIYAHHHPDFMENAKRGIERSKRRMN